MSKFDIKYGNDQKVESVRYETWELYPTWTVNDTWQANLIFLQLFRDHGMAVVEPLCASYLATSAGAIDTTLKQTLVYEAARFNIETQGRKAYTVDRTQLKPLLEEQALIATFNQRIHDPNFHHYMMTVAVKHSYRKLICRMAESSIDLPRHPYAGSDHLLHLAALRGWVDVLASCFKRKDLNINERDSNMATALHIAVKEGEPDIVEMLISQKADLWLQKSNGNTPLHDAVDSLSVGAVKILLKNIHRLDLFEIKNNKNKTPRDLAFEARGVESVAHNSPRYLKETRNLIVDLIRIRRLEIGSSKQTLENSSEAGTPVRGHPLSPFEPAAVALPPPQHTTQPSGLLVHHYTALPSPKRADNGNKPSSPLLPVTPQPDLPEPTTKRGCLCM